MLKKLNCSLIALAIGGTAMSAPAQAAEPSYSPTAKSFPGIEMVWNHGDPDDWDDDDWDDDWEDDDDDDDDRWKKRRYRDRHYGRDRYRYRDGGRYYGEPVYRSTRVWRGRDGRVYCRKNDGTTGLIVGGALGAILGREIDTRGDRTIGTILGAAGGAIVGRELDRGRCR